MDRHATAADARPAVVLMYHALRRDEAPPGQDPHYTLHADAFDRQLAAIARAGGAGTVRDHIRSGQRRPVLLTFDDGHASNHALAFPALLEHGVRADFFVNPANVGKPGFATWAQLREMSDAGMSIQSHGYDHTYFTDMDRPTLRERLHAARLRIEDEVGAPVELLAPPGGRMPAGLPALARRCGYRHVVASRPGRLRPGHAPDVVPRLAVTSNLDEGRFQAWISGRATAVYPEQLRYATLAMAKGLLGNARYERARTLLLAGRGG